ncbi:MAG: hypothetical protein JJU37_05540 [Balneolaceae bacterium]|nr:hypothetical protein [Balneolaceae bacterium]
MSKVNATKLFEEAEEDLKRASQELYRPSEDVVSFSACVFSRRSLYKYLQGLAILYAEEKKIMLEPNLTIDQLITFCSQYNKNLKKVDFSSLYCKCNDILKDPNEDIEHCTSVDMVSYCADLAEKVRGIVKEKMN